MNTSNPSEIDLSAIAANAVENAELWLDSAWVKAYRAEITPDAVMVAGFMVASAISYHADRQVDAAEIIARAIREAASQGGGNG